MMSAKTRSASFVPKSCETGDVLSLAMQNLWLTGRILSVGARLIVCHVFRSSEKKPLEVIYTFALPRDATLRRFRVTGPGFSVRSELKPLEEAAELYEEGLAQGHLSGLAKQYGDGIVSLNLGNIRPHETVKVYLEIIAGVEMHDDGIRFRFPFTLAPRYHSRARWITVDPGVGESELPEDEFDDLILPPFAAGPSSMHGVGFNLSIYMPAPITALGSPSHAVRATAGGSTRASVSLAPERDVPDRDLVLEVRTKGLSGTLVGMDKEGKGRFVVVVPSDVFGQPDNSSRRVVFVIDRSGSMQGAPIERAKKAIQACLGGLSKTDLFGLIAFDDRLEVFKPALVSAGRESRHAARDFVNRIEARGGTELVGGVLEASRLLKKDGGDVLVVTDGQVAGTEQIIEQARNGGIRIHCLGIGSASQDRFLTLLARATGGVSRFLTARERVDIEAVDLFASVGRPVATELKVKPKGIRGVVLAPKPPLTIFADNPVAVFGETPHPMNGSLLFEWNGGKAVRSFEVQGIVKKDGVGETIRLLQGARLITDLDSQLIYADSTRPAGQRTYQRLSKALETLSRTYGLASRRMAVVAVVQRDGDQPGEIPQTRVVPIGMPQDTSFFSYFTAAAPRASRVQLIQAREEVSSFAFASVVSEARSPVPLQRFVEFSEAGIEEDLLLLASRIEPDGGMPGESPEERILLTAVALLCLISEGNTDRSGPFRVHVQRLITFLKTAPVDSLSEAQQEAIGRLEGLATEGTPVAGNWLALARDTLGLKPPPVQRLWSELEGTLKIV